MVRQLKMADVITIQTLHASGYSNREIARLTGVHRDTVARYLAAGGSEPAKPDHRVLPGPANACEPFREQIISRLEAGLSGTRIYQDLRDEHGFQGSYSSVRRFIQVLQKSTPVPFRRIEVLPGEEAQIDFGTAAPVLRNGKARRPWMFRIGDIVKSCVLGFPQAASCNSPLTNVLPSRSSGSMSLPLSFLQCFSADLPSLNIMARLARREPLPLVLRCR